MRIRDLNIGHKLLLVIGVTTLAALGVAATVQVLYERHATRGYLVGELTVLARAVADRSTAAVAFLDSDTALKNLTAFEAHASVDLACLYIADGSPIALYRRAGLAEVPCPAPAGNDGVRFSDRGVRIQQTVILEDAPIGTLVLAANLDLVDRRVNAFLQVSALILVGAALLSALFAWRLQRIISLPIRRLADTAERVSSTADYSLRAQSGSSDETGRLVEAFNGMLATIRERERSLSESEARYRTLVEGISAVIYRGALDAGGTLSYVSPRVQRMLGYTPGRWLEDPGLFSRCLHPEDRERVLAARAGARERGRGYGLEYRMLREDGGEVWVRDEAEPVLDALDKPQFLQGLWYDVTEFHRMQRALRFRLEFERAVEEISRRFINSEVKEIGAAIDWSLARAGNLVRAGRAYLFQLSPDATRMSNTHEWCAPGVSAEMHHLQQLAIADYPFIFDLFRRGEPFRLADLSDIPREQAAFRRLLERQSVVSLINVPVAWEGELRGFLGFDAVQQPATWLEQDLDLLRIVAEIMASALQRCEAQSALQQLNEKLERRVEERTADLLAANQELEAFTYSVSHDLRSPLLVLDGFSQALVEDYGDQLDEQACRYLGFLREGTQELSALIDGLLLLSRASRGEMQRRDLDLSAMVNGCVEELRHADPGREVACAVQPGLKAYGDPRLVKSVVENLVGNAWKYTGRTAHPRIEVGITEEAGRAMFFVRDNGAGFNMDYADKLFQPFQRMHRADEFPGTGIGLATVKRIVGRHGGRVWAEAEEGHGATFYFSFGLPEE